MPLQTSGPISLGNIQSEFGGSNPINLSEYYSNGSYVRANTVGFPNGSSTAIPSSNKVSLSNFYGSSRSLNKDLFNGTGYPFKVLVQSSSSSNAVAGGGMPSNYSSGYYGSVIWPSPYGRTNGTFVGTVIYPNTNKLTITATCDNEFTFYFNNLAVLSGNNWGIWYSTTVNVVKNDILHISAKVANWGGPQGFAARITEENGTVAVLTSTSWVSGR